MPTIVISVPCSVVMKGRRRRLAIICWASMAAVDFWLGRYHTMLEQQETSIIAPWFIAEVKGRADRSIEQLHRRGCVVIRGHFDRDQALAWDQGILDYVEGNGFFDAYSGPADDFFGSVGSRPEIYPVYWSKPQMEARQSDRMANVQSFLNHQWTYESDGVQWFDPDQESLYPDRICQPSPSDSSL